MDEMDALVAAIQRWMKPMRCTQPGRPAPGIEHCAGCCMRTGYVATCIEEQKVCDALDQALSAIHRYQQMLIR